MSEKGKFNVTIDGKPREVVISLGLRRELFKVLTLKQLEYQGMTTKSLLGPDDVKLIQELSDKLTNSGGDAAVEADIRREIDSAYAAAFKNLEVNQHKFMRELALFAVDVGETSVTELLALVLTERDEYGKIVNLVTPEDVMWKPVYAENIDALMDLATAVAEYMSEALKKISKFNNLVYSLVPPAQS